MLEQLQFPVQPYEVKGHAFGARVRSRVILWARHLGDDVIVPAGTPVAAVGEGVVVWAQVRPGSPVRRNWGGIVVLEHAHKQKSQKFYSLYGHMTGLTVKVGNSVSGGQKLGEVAEGSTPQNGWWKIPHLHFAIYTGPWTDTILPGYKRFFESRTRFDWWQDPHPFIDRYNSLA